MKLKVADLALDEVVVIGYGTAKKGNVTGSIATLKGEKVADRQNENVLSSLQGQLAGVEITTNSGAPGGELEVHIRGAASINASDQPLYVVDGIPVDDLSDLNADDIESIDVLKMPPLLLSTVRAALTALSLSKLKKRRKRVR